LSTSKEIIGIAGLGFVGRAIATRLQQVGYSLCGYDPSDSAWTECKGLSIKRLSDLTALSHQCTTLLICVLNDKMLIDVCHAVCQTDKPPQRMICFVTCSPQAIDQVSKQMSDKGVVFMDMPMSGSAYQIQIGEALGLLGANPKDFVDAQYLLNDLAPHLRHVGAVGAGTRAKLASNLVLGLNRAALAEGLNFAKVLGLDVKEFLVLLKESPAYSRAVDVAGPKMIEEQFKPGSRITQHRKDIAIMLDVADQLKMTLPLTQGHADLMDQAIAMGLGDLDNSALMIAYQRNSKVG